MMHHIVDPPTIRQKAAEERTAKDAKGAKDRKKRVLNGGLDGR
jgi:hypothetical protein